MEWKNFFLSAPASSFQIYLIGGDDEFQGDEVVLCDATNVSPKPDFNLLLGGEWVYTHGDQLLLN